MISRSALGERTERAPEWLRLGGLWLLLAAAGALWVVSSPLMSVPDEPAHTIKAVAVWRGEFKGRPVDLDVYSGESERARTYEVEVTASYASALDLPTCYAFHPEIAANCAPDAAASDKVVTTRTLAGAYPPLYYVLVGWPSLLASGEAGMYSMRLASLAVSSAMLLLGAWALRRFLRWRSVLLILAVAATPVVYYLAGSINPNGLEVTAGFATWATATAGVLTWSRQGRVDRRLMAALALSVGVAANQRALSPLFVAIILGVVALFAGRRQLTVLLGDRRCWVPIGATFAAAATSLVWVLLVDPLGTVTGGKIVVPDENIVLTLGAMTDDWIAQMVAFFGWSDVGPVVAAVWIWLLVSALLIGLAALTAGPWRASILMLTVVGVVFAPVILQYPAAKNGVIIWQGRYLLPLAIGIPVLAVAAANERDLFRSLERRLAVGAAVLLGVAHVAAHMSAMRRYVAGVRHRLNYFQSPVWSPPVGTVVLLMLTTAVVVIWVVLVSYHHDGLESTATLDEHRPEAD